MSNSAATAAVRNRENDNEYCPDVDGSSDAVIDPEKIAKLAHSYWLERAGDQGSAEEDWYRAEGELRRRARANGAEEGSL